MRDLKNPGLRPKVEENSPHPLAAKVSAITERLDNFVGLDMVTLPPLASFPELPSMSLTEAPGRDRLPDRRYGETFKLAHVWGRATAVEQAEIMTVTIGCYPGGQIGEVFVNCENHINERATAMWHDIGVLVSIALQRGATLDELASAMTHNEVPVMDRIERVPGSPAGTLLNHLREIEQATFSPQS